MATLPHSLYTFPAHARLVLTYNLVQKGSKGGHKLSTVNNPHFDILCAAVEQWAATGADDTKLMYILDHQ